jgi:hypothetical protein
MQSKVASARPSSCDSRNRDRRVRTISRAVRFRTRASRAPRSASVSTSGASFGLCVTHLEPATIFLTQDTRHAMDGDRVYNRNLPARSSPSQVIGGFPRRRLASGKVAATTASQMAMSLAGWPGACPCGTCASLRLSVRVDSASALRTGRLDDDMPGSPLPQVSALHLCLCL